MKFMRLSPTFREEFDAGTYSAYYRPARIFVLCDAGTMSAGFSVVSEFDFFGAVTVGTPPAQAPNSYGAAAVFALTHTGIKAMVPMIPAFHFRCRLAVREGAAARLPDDLRAAEVVRFRPARRVSLRADAKIGAPRNAPPAGANDARRRPRDTS